MFQWESSLWTARVSSQAYFSKERGIKNYRENQKKQEFSWGASDRFVIWSSFWLWTCIWMWFLFVCNIWTCVFLTVFLLEFCTMVLCWWQLKFFSKSTQERLCVMQVLILHIWRNVNFCGWEHILTCKILSILITHHSGQNDGMLVTVTMAVAAALHDFCNHCKAWFPYDCRQSKWIAEQAVNFLMITNYHRWSQNWWFFAAHITLAQQCFSKYRYIHRCMQI